MFEIDEPTMSALRVWGMLVMVIFVSWNVYRNINVFKIMYFLYTRTPIGSYVHNKALAKSRGKPAHRKDNVVDCGSYVVRSIAFLGDNYSFLIEDKATHKCALVDPADAQRALLGFATHCKDRNLTDAGLEVVLTTHYHMDHAGGNKALRSKLPDLKVYGGHAEPVCGRTNACRGGDTIKIGSTSVSVMETPCHTKGHLMFYVKPSGSGRGSLFTGDALFVGGCGKFFEGNGAQMAKLTMEVLPALPGNTYVFCGHEYTLENAKFGSWIEPANTACQALLEKAEKAQADNVPTVPSTLDEEAAHNPFMRLDNEMVRAKAGAYKTHPQGQVAQVLRSMKDRNVHRQDHSIEDEGSRKFV